MDKYFETDDAYVYLFEDEERLAVLYELLAHPKGKDSDYVLDIRDTLEEYEKITGPQYNALVRIYKRYFK